jgi:hypothetical protein
MTVLFQQVGSQVAAGITTYLKVVVFHNAPRHVDERNRIGRRSVFLDRKSVV